jgi:hypothetical protein
VCRWRHSAARRHTHTHTLNPRASLAHKTYVHITHRQVASSKPSHLLAPCFFPNLPLYIAAPGPLSKRRRPSSSLSTTTTTTTTTSTRRAALWAIVSHGDASTQLPLPRPVATPSHERQAHISNSREPRSWRDTIPPPVLSSVPSISAAFSGRFLCLRSCCLLGSPAPGSRRWRPRHRPRAQPLSRPHPRRTLRPHPKHNIEVESKFNATRHTRTAAATGPTAAAACTVSAAHHLQSDIFRLNHIG